MGNCAACNRDQSDSAGNSNTTTGTNPPANTNVVASGGGNPGRRRRQGTDRGSSSNPVATNEATVYIPVRKFRYKELADATNNFRPQNIIGRGGFGPVFRGQLKNGRAVAVKRLDENSQQGEEQFNVEIEMLTRLHHPNIVTLIGYSNDKKQYLLVYDHMPLGSLDTHLYDLPLDRLPLDWNTRMKIAFGIAKGMEYLHDRTDPQVICRDFKSSNILLDEGFLPKISDFGLARYGPEGDSTHVYTRIMGTYGYCAPEYGSIGHLNSMCDVHSFGAVLLEIVSGRKVIDRTRPSDERNLVTWALSILRDRNKFETLADPLLQGRFPKQALYHVLAIAAMCLVKDPSARPEIGHVITGLTYLEAYEPEAAASGSNGGGGGPSIPRSADDPKDRAKAKVDDTYPWLPQNPYGGSGRKTGLDDIQRQESRRGSPGIQELQGNLDLAKEPLNEYMYE